MPPQCGRHTIGEGERSPAARTSSRRGSDRTGDQLSDSFFARHQSAHERATTGLERLARNEHDGSDRERFAERNSAPHRRGRGGTRIRTDGAETDCATDRAPDASSTTARRFAGYAHYARYTRTDADRDPRAHRCSDAGAITLADTDTSTVSNGQPNAVTVAIADPHTHTHTHANADADADIDPPDPAAFADTDDQDSVTHVAHRRKRTLGRILRSSSVGRSQKGVAGCG